MTLVKIIQLLGLLLFHAIIKAAWVPVCR